MIDRRLLDILCDPVTKTPVRPLRRDELDALNRAIAGGAVDTVAGQKVASPLLQLTADLYRIAHSALGEEADHVEAVKLLEQWAGVEIS